MGKHIALFILLCAPFGLCAETAGVRTTYNDGKVASKSMELEALGGGVFRARIPIADIPKNAKFIDVVYGGAVAKKGEDGYFVLGDNRLGHFTKDKGDLELWSMFVNAFGMKNPRGAFVGIIKGMTYEAAVKVTVKDDEYNIFPRFQIGLRGYDPYEDIIVDFYNLKDADADYCGMARTYRGWQLGRGEVKPLKERVKSNPQLAYTADTMFVRVKLGIKDLKNRVAHQTPETEPKLQVYYTYDKFSELMQNLKNLGVDKVEMCMVGWQAGGFDGRYPQYFPVPEEFGGLEKLKAAIDTAHKLGYQIVSHTNATEWVEIGEGFDIDDIIHTPNGKRPPEGGAWVGGITYKPCPQRVYDRFIERNFKQISELGFKGTHHIDVITCMRSRSCSNPKHPLNNRQSVEYLRKIGEAADKYFGGFGSECGIDHVADSLDYALYISAYPKYMGPAHPLADTLIPFWQLVYHGIILSNPYLETIDYAYKNKQTMLGIEFLKSYEKRRLKLIEYGGRPTFYFADYRDLTPIKAAYDEYQKLKHLQYEFMESHEEISPDVFRVRYSNGEEIVCNYTDRDFSYKGAAVKPLDYILFGK